VDTIVCAENTRKLIQKVNQEMAANERIRFGIWYEYHLVGVIGCHHIDARTGKPVSAIGSMKGLKDMALCCKLAEDWLTWLFAK
jgi:hypothetical protein